MKFTLLTSRTYYSNEWDSSEIAVLKRLGFTFTPSPYEPETRVCIKGNPAIEISSIDELVEFTKKHGKIVLEDVEIEIYNDYSE